MERAHKLPVNIAAGSASKSLDNEPIHIEPGDYEVVRRCQRGDLNAYEILVTRYRHKVFGLALSMLRNEADATDVAQEAFVRAWQAIRNFKGTASFYTWIYRITTNLCIDFVRKRNRQPSAPFEEAIDPDTDANVAEPPSTNPLPTQEMERRELGERIAAAIEELSPDHRAVIHLREYEGLEYADIAKAVGCSIGTVMSRLHYARKHLQKLLKDES